jgi:hypothetical protein
MKIARFFAYLFACIGMVLLVGSMGFLLLNREAEVKIRELPQEAIACADAFAQALNDGDLEAAVQMIYGQPDLGVAGNPEAAETASVWNAFVESIAFEYTGKWQVADHGLSRKATITAMDVASVLETLPELAQALVNQKIASAEELTEVYDESGSFREELVEGILQQAVQQTLSQNADVITRETGVKFVKRNGTWWVVPDQALLHALSGSV